MYSSVYSTDVLDQFFVVGANVVRKHEAEMKERTVNSHVVNYLKPLMAANYEVQNIESLLSRKHMREQFRRQASG